MRHIMRRYHLIELHEQTWIPSLWRKMFQQSMGRAVTLIDPFRNCARPFSNFLDRIGATSILDLCSGSAEPLLQMREALCQPLTEGSRPTLVLSDLYPNFDEFRRIKEHHDGDVDFYPRPVDALRPPADAPRVRTMFNALHHFTPQQVREILTDAAKNADGVAIFESTSRTWSCMLMTLPNPIVAGLINACMLRPYRPWHLLWGAAIPVLPLMALFDGLVSNLRSYTPEELDEIAKSIDVPEFEWEIGTAKIPRTPLKATYLFGWKRSSVRST